MSAPLVVGLGSHFGDDQAGWLIVDQLRELGYPESNLRKAQHPTDILDLLEQFDRLLICDACHGAGSAGTIHRWPWPSEYLVHLHADGTHDMGLNQVLNLANELGWRPSSVSICAIEGQTWFPSLDAGSEVFAATELAAKTIWEEFADA